MGTCDCGNDTDWTEMNGTWICVACRAEGIEKHLRELREGLEKMEQAERSLLRLGVNTEAISDLLAKVGQDINKLKVS